MPLWDDGFDTGWLTEDSESSVRPKHPRGRYRGFVGRFFGVIREMPFLPDDGIAEIGHLADPTENANGPRRHRRANPTNPATANTDYPLSDAVLAIFVSVQDWGAVNVTKPRRLQSTRNVEAEYIFTAVGLPEYNPVVVVYDVVASTKPRRVGAAQQPLAQDAATIADMSPTLDMHFVELSFSSFPANRHVKTTAAAAVDFEIPPFLFGAGLWDDAFFQALTASAFPSHRQITRRTAASVEDRDWSDVPGDRYAPEIIANLSTEARPTRSLRPGPRLPDAFDIVVAPDPAVTYELGWQTIAASAVPRKVGRAHVNSDQPDMVAADHEAFIIAGGWGVFYAPQARQVSPRRHIGLARTDAQTLPIGEEILLAWMGSPPPPVRHARSVVGQQFFAAPDWAVVATVPGPFYCVNGQIFVAGAVRGMVLPEGC